MWGKMNCQESICHTEPFFLFSIPLSVSILQDIPSFVKAGFIDAPTCCSSLFQGASPSKQAFPQP
jgi:hypothetical protein